MSYCDGDCPNLNDRAHKCELTGEKLTQLKSWWGTTHEHRGFCEYEKANIERAETIVTVGGYKE